MKPWMHCILWLIVGFLIGYYFPSIGDASVGKLYAKS